MPYFIKTTDDAGNEIYREVDEKEIVVNSPEYKSVTEKAQKVTQESIERRKTIADLKKQLEALSAGDGAEEKPEEKPAQQPVVPVVNPDEIVTAVEKRLAEKQAAEAKAKQERADYLNSIVKKHGLGKEALILLDKSTDPEGLAAGLAQAGYKFDSVDGGNAGGTGGSGVVDTSKLLEKLGLPK